MVMEGLMPKPAAQAAREKKNQPKIFEI